MTQRSGSSDFICSQTSGLEHRQAGLLGGDLEGVGLALVRCDIDADDVLVPLDELLQDSLSEGLLAVHDETHVEFLPQKLFVIP